MMVTAARMSVLKWFDWMRLPANTHTYTHKHMHTSSPSSLWAIIICSFTFHQWHFTILLLNFLKLFQCEIIWWEKKKKKMCVFIFLVGSIMHCTGINCIKIYIYVKQLRWVAGKWHPAGPRVWRSGLGWIFRSFYSPGAAFTWAVTPNTCVCYKAHRKNIPNWYPANRNQTFLKDGATARRKALDRLDGPESNVHVKAASTKKKRLHQTHFLFRCIPATYTWYF